MGTEDAEAPISDVNRAICMRPEIGKKIRPQSQETMIQAMVLGNVAIVGVPAEYFTVLGVDIKRRSPFEHTYIAELANDGSMVITPYGGPTNTASTVTNTYPLDPAITATVMSASAATAMRCVIEEPSAVGNVGGPVAAPPRSALPSTPSVGHAGRAAGPGPRP